MATALARHIIGIFLGIVLFTGTGFAVEPALLEKFVKARIDIGEMMMNYFSSGEMFGGGQPPSPERMRDMRADINEKLAMVIAKYDLTVEEYRQQSPEVFADDAAVQRFLSENPDLKKRYEAIPVDRMGRGRSGRGY